MTSKTLLVLLLCLTGIGPEAAQEIVRAPQNVRADVTGSTVTLTWAAPSIGPVPEAYVVEAAPSPGGAAIASLPTSTNPLSVPNVPSGVYYVRVFSVVGGVRSGPSNEVVVAVGGPVAGTCQSAPNAPQDVSGTVSGTVVNLTWTPAPLGCAATAYLIQAGSAAGLTDVAQVNVGAATTLSTSAPAGTYYVRVIAVNASGSSSPSSEVTLAVGTTGALFGGRLSASFVQQNGFNAIAADIDGTLAATITKPATASLGAAVLRLPDGNTVTVVMGDNGRPARAVIGDSILVFANYTVTTVDVAVLAPGRPTTYHRRVPLRSSLSGVAGDLLVADAGRTLKRELSDWALAVSAATCLVVGIPAAGTPPLLVAVSALGCAVTAREVWNRLHGGPDEDQELVASRDAANHVAGAIQCAGGIGQRNPGTIFECASFVAGGVAKLANDYLTARQADVDAATAALSQQATGANGTWTGTWRKRAFPSEPLIIDATFTFTEDSNGNIAAVHEGTARRLAGRRFGDVLYLDRVDGANCERWQLTISSVVMSGTSWYSCGPLGSLGVAISDVNLTRVTP